MAAAAALHGKRIWAAERKKFYYANIVTRKTVWSEPAEGWHEPVAQRKAAATVAVAETASKRGRRQSSPWLRKRDNRSQRFFYANTETRKTVWIEPVEGWREAKAAKQPTTSSPAIKTVPRVQPDVVPGGRERDSKCNQFKAVASVTSPVKRGRRPGSPWIRKYDPKSKRHFYANMKTRQTVWKEPAE